MRGQVGDEGVRGCVRLRLRVRMAGQGCAAIGEIGVWEAEAEAQFGDAGLLGDGGAFDHRRLHRPHHGALRTEREPVVELPVGFGEGLAAGDPLEQQGRGAGAGSGMSICG